MSLSIASPKSRVSALEGAKPAAPNRPTGTHEGGREPLFPNRLPIPQQGELLHPFAPTSIQLGINRLVTGMELVPCREAAAESWTRFHDPTGRTSVLVALSPESDGFQPVSWAAKSSSKPASPARSTA